MAIWSSRLTKWNSENQALALVDLFPIQLFLVLVHSGQLFKLAAQSKIRVDVENISLTRDN